MEEEKKLQEGADDLEDGEIESDDEPIITMVIPSEKSATGLSMSPAEKKCDSDTAAKSSEVFNTNSSKFKKLQVVDDDWAGNIENAIAAALKKDGIEPPFPKLDKREEYSNSRDVEKDEDIRKARKRKKREDRDKNKKRIKNSTEDTKGDPEDIDDYEMLCIRGGSPPRSVQSDLVPPVQPQLFYDSDDSYSSYGSYDSGEYRQMSYDERRHCRRAKDRRQRKFSGRQGGTEKRRNRHDSDGGDDCQRQHDARSQRKLELCKFYLMECCAKKEKCSYMHGDFPCKYYYLGMECVYKAACKFSHGKPLTEQLRNILLKHIETAPKEILGNFRRISREHATTLLNSTHAKLCQEHNIQNTLAPAVNPTTSITTTMSSQKPLTSTTSATDQTAVIPSLLDMNIKPPVISPRKDDKDRLNKSDKPRKSRWCDFTQTSKTTQLASVVPSLSSTVSSAQPTISAVGVANSADVLSLKNLKGVLTPGQIEKLHAIGVENLEQISQLTVAQLNNVGLTISQINEIQLNALNIQKLGLINTLNSNIPSQQPVSLFTESPAEGSTMGKSNNQDVDMRFLVGSSTVPMQSITQDSEKSLTLSDAGIASPEPTPNSGKQEVSTHSVVPLDSQEKKDNVVNYSQYLKDSNLDAEKTDFDYPLYDDVLNEDEPELLIDESWCSSDEERDKNETSQNTIKSDDETNDKPMPAVYDPKSLFSPKLSNVIDVSSSVSNMFGSTSCVMYNELEIKDKSESEGNEGKLDDSSSGEYRDPRLGSTSKSNDVAREVVEPPKYQRSSIYDGIVNNNPSAGSADFDNSRMAYVDTPNSDIDLRLPFKPVMTNYIPATEIDGSIASHSPITYKVCEVDIPKPDYCEIRSSVAVTEKTLDPRLRRIFCLKESILTESTSDSDSILMSMTSPTSKQNDIQSSAVDKSNISSGPRIDPRRRKENQDSIASNLTSHSQNVDTRILLQKSNWYKNLNSTYKIMVNQQLALLSTELKKFQQDPSPTKVFDMKFIISNQNLQQVLTNLGIYIDANGQILQLDGEGDCESATSVGMASNMNMHGMSENTQSPIGLPSMDFMRTPGINMNSMYMPMSGKPFGPRFNDVRPGLLGIAPGVHPYNPFDTGSNNDGTNNFIDNDLSRSFGGGNVGDNNNMGGGRVNNPFEQNVGNFYCGPHRDTHDGRQIGNRGNRNNYRQSGGGGQNARNNSGGERWSMGGGGGNNNMGQSGRNSGGRRNYDSRGVLGRDRDIRRDKLQK